MYAATGGTGAQTDHRTADKTPGHVRRQELQTLQDVMHRLGELATTQLQTATYEHAPENTCVSGDTQFKRMMYTLLPSQYQRQIFIDCCSNRHMWPRLRCLFGAPPYAFLHPGDDGILNATGICAARRNITFQDKQLVMSYSQFGEAQMLDSSGRQYRISEHDPSPLSGVSAACLLRPRSVYELVVRIPKTSQGTRRSAAGSACGRVADRVFPQRNTKIHLCETSLALRMRGGVNAVTASMRVLAVMPRSTCSATARVLCRSC